MIDILLPRVCAVLDLPHTRPRRDADRLLAVDENGNQVDGDVIMAIVGNHMKEKGTLKDNTKALSVKKFDAVKLHWIVRCRDHDSRIHSVLLCQIGNRRRGEEIEQEPSEEMNNNDISTNNNNE